MSLCISPYPKIIYIPTSITIMQHRKVLYQTRPAVVIMQEPSLGQGSLATDCATGVGQFHA